MDIAVICYLCVASFVLQIIGENLSVKVTLPFSKKCTFEKLVFDKYIPIGTIAPSYPLFFDDPRRNTA